ncbi:hypothetical protein [Fatsia badnavirus 1]|uniref:Uncharacterized protein n=1 Tax=Fatsia badnavirus 1 TaxID=2999080 RepID=A0A9E8Z0K5_9VIRU|nr:hypothetical protein [Fatsia badnavirus 1]
MAGDTSSYGSNSIGGYAHSDDGDSDISRLCNQFYRAVDAFQAAARQPMPWTESEERRRQLYELQQQIYKLILSSLDTLKEFAEVHRDIMSHYATRDNYWGDWLPYVKRNAELIKDAVERLKTLVDQVKDIQF